MLRQNREGKGFFAIGKSDKSDWLIMWLFEKINYLLYLVDPNFGLWPKQNSIFQSKLDQNSLVRNIRSYFLTAGYITLRPEKYLSFPFYY